MFENFNYKVLWLYCVYMSLLALCCPISTKLCFYKKIILLSFNMSWIAYVTIFITGNIAVHISFYEPCTPCLLLGKELGTVQEVPSYERTLKCTLVQALRLCTGRTAHRTSRGIALLVHDHSTRREWEVSIMPWPLFTPGKGPVPIVQEAG